MSSGDWFHAAHGRGASAVRAPDGAARDFHRSLPGYAATPLVELPAPAGVGRLLVKDESARFDLAAFKFLGASWAVVRALAERAGLEDRYDVDELRRHVAASPPYSLVTATDGNHGRAVARMGQLLGIPVRVHVPPVPPVVVDRILAEGADLVRHDGDYDTAVAHAAADVDAEPAAILVQDTAWDGYETIPGWIVDGYETLFAEVDEQLGAAPDLLLVPVGVGSLAQAAVAHHARTTTRVVGVEPDTAACVLRSLQCGEPTTVATADSVMNGLNCGTPSALAWPVLRDGLAGAIAVTDDECRIAMAELTAGGLATGPSGAASYAGLRRLLAEPGGSAGRDALGLEPDATVVCLNTEGRLDPA